MITDKSMFTHHEGDVWIHNVSLAPYLKFTSDSGKVVFLPLAT